MKLYTTGVYVIICHVNQFHYVGGSRACVLNRFGWHKFALRHNHHCNKQLQHDWNSFGENNFSFKLLKACVASKVIKEEQKVIDYWESKNLLYNIQPLAGTALGFNLTATQRKRASSSAKARCTPAWRKAVSERVKLQHKQGRFGKHTWNSKL